MYSIYSSAENWIRVFNFFQFHFKILIGFFIRSDRNYFFCLPARIASVNRIIPDISIEVDLILIADGIGLQEPAERGGVDAGLVIIHAEVGQPDLAGVAEPTGFAGTGDAVFVIGVDRLAVARAVGGGDDRALRVWVQEPRVRAVEQAAAVFDHRLVHAGPEQIAFEHRAAGVVFRHEVVAIVKIARRAAGAAAAQ